MKQLLVMGIVLMTGVSAFGAEYWYYGPSNVWDDVSCYTKDEAGKTPASEKPGAGDIVYLKGGKDYYIDDSTIGFFSTIKDVYVRYANTHVNIHLERDAEFGCHIGEFAQRGLADQFIVKTGPGALIFSKTGCTHGSGQNWYDYNIGLDVREGDVYLEPSDGVSSHRNYHRDLIVAKGCTIHCVTNGINWVNSIAGEGTITSDAEVAGNTVLYLTTASKDPPAVFSGRLTGKWNAVYFGANQRMTGTANDFTGTTRLQGYDGDPAKGVTGFLTLATPGGQPSSLGTSTSFDSRAPFRLLYLGDTGETIVRNINQIWDTASAPCVIDGGHHGGLVWTGSFAPRTQNFKQQRLGLSGSNTVACVLSNAWSKVSDHGTNCSFYVTKDGSGTWRFLHRDDRKWSGALAVKEGTVEFDTLAEQGKLCALGTADELYEDKMGYPADLQTVPYAWLLGTAGDVTKVGTLSYLGDEDFQLNSRKTALAGAGRLRTKAGSLLKYSAGITGYGAGEKEIRFENGAGATNVVSGVSDGADGAVVSVVKEGPGSYTLTGDLGFTGDLRVLGGDLTLKDINGAKFRWYRFNFKENRCTSTNDAFANYVVLTGENSKRNPTRAIRLDEVGLYDANGKRLNNPSTTVASIPTNATYLALNPGEVALKDDIAGKLIRFNTKYGPHDVRHLFDNGHSSGLVFYVRWGDEVTPPTFDKPETWFVAYQRLPDDKAEAVSYDLCFATPGDGPQTDAAAQPTAFSIDASADGATWQEVAAKDNFIYYQTNSYAWVSNDKSAGWDGASTKPESVAHPNKFPLAASRQQGTYARPVPRSVAVASGAKLTVEGAPVTASGVTLGTDGFGTVSGVRLAESGTVDLVCDLSAKPEKVVFPADFSQFGDADNVLGYGVTVNGGAVPRAYEASVTPNGAVLLRKGLVLIVR